MVANKEMHSSNEEAKNDRRGKDFVPLGEDDLTHLNPNGEEYKENITVVDEFTHPLSPEGTSTEKNTMEGANMSASESSGMKSLLATDSDSNRTILAESMDALKTSKVAETKQLHTGMARKGARTTIETNESKITTAPLTNPSYRQATTQGFSSLCSDRSENKIKFKENKFLDRGDAEINTERSAIETTTKSGQKKSKLGSFLRRSLSSEDKSTKNVERKSKSRSFKKFKSHLTGRWSIQGSRSSSKQSKDKINMPKGTPSCWLNLLAHTKDQNLYDELFNVMSSTAYDWSQVPCMPKFVDTESIEFVKREDNSPIQIGVGNFGSVYLARRVIDNELVVLKYIRVRSFGLFELIKEAGFNQILSDAFGQPAPKFFGLINRPLDNDHWPLALVSEFVGDPITHKVFNLCDVLRCCTDNTTRIDKTEKTWLNVCIELTEAIANIHNLSIYINDLKTDNIILRPVRGGKWRIYIIDYGNATRGHHRLQLSTGGMSEQEFLTTYGQVAPEVLRKGYCSPASDIYSLGNILIMIHSCNLVGKTVSDLGSRCLLEDFQARPSTAHITKQLMALYQASLCKQKSFTMGDISSYSLKYQNTNLVQSVV